MSSDSGSFGGGFSGGDFSGGGFSGSDFSEGDQRRDGGSFGGGFDRRDEGGGGYFPSNPWLPTAAAAAAAGVAGYAIARNTGGPTGHFWHQSPPEANPFLPPYHGGQQGGYYPPPPLVVEVQGRQRIESASRPFLRFVNIAVVVVALWIYFAAYSSQKVTVYLHEHRILRANPIFARSINVYPLNPTLGVEGPTLFRFSSPPPLSKKESWVDDHDDITVRKYGYESWNYWFNAGSKVKVSYSINRKASLYFAVIKGSHNMALWKKDPQTFSDYEVRTYLSGSSTFKFVTSSEGQYYFAFGNFRYYPVQMSVAFDIESRVFDLSSAFSVCDINSMRLCTHDLLIYDDPVAVLAAPPTKSIGVYDSSWLVEVSYLPRWQAYVLLVGLTFLATYAVSMHLARVDAISRRTEERGPSSAQASHTTTTATTSSSTSSSERSPLIPPISSSLPPPPKPTSSRSPSLPNSSKAVIPNTWVVSSASAPPLPRDLRSGGEEEGVSEADLCVICMAAKKDSVILDCGHRATCLSCANLLMESPSRQCPICRNPIRHVAKIFDS